MFTGLITDVGTIDRVITNDAGREFHVRSSYKDVAEGESVAVNGVCLTVRERDAGWFTVAAVNTTLGRTTIGEWKEGRRVNLERALTAGDRFGGHFVLGHVDGCAQVERVKRAGDALLVDLSLPADLAALIVPHGSIAVDGVSLTVNAIPDAQSVQLSLIEYTLHHATLGSLHVGDRVNVEADVLGKYVQRLLAPHLAAAAE
ncbi:MAG: riboflavin synthase [Gemmatimonadales bacterium]